MSNQAHHTQPICFSAVYEQYPPPTSLLWPKMRGGLAIRTTPRTSEQAAANRKTPQRSSSRKTERVMTKTGEEKRMVVESPRGSLSKVVKRKSLKSGELFKTLQKGKV